MILQNLLIEQQCSNIYYMYTILILYIYYLYTIYIACKKHQRSSNMSMRAYMKHGIEHDDSALFPHVSTLQPSPPQSLSLFVDRSSLPAPSILRSIIAACAIDCRSHVHAECHQPRCEEEWPHSGRTQQCPATLPSVWSRWRFGQERCLTWVSTFFKFPGWCKYNIPNK